MHSSGFATARLLGGHAEILLDTFRDNSMETGMEKLLRYCVFEADSEVLGTTCPDTLSPYLQTSHRKICPQNLYLCSP
jgi:hypothetical protein